MKHQSQRIEITTFPEIEVLVYPSQEHAGWWIVKSMIQTFDSETGKAAGFMSVIRKKPLTGRAPGRERLGSWIREAVARQLLHELDEGLRIDGKRHREPHPKPAKKKAKRP